MKRLFGIFALLALAVGFTACEEVAPVDKTYTVELTADKNRIVADGAEVVTFAIEVDGQSMNEDVQVILLNDNSVLSGMTFSTTTPGEYRFVAAYKSFTSEPFTVTATPIEEHQPTVTLKADVVTFMAGSGEFVTFTVTADGEDVTSDSTIINVDTEEPLTDNTFTTDVAGDYKFKAIYNEYESNTQIIVVTPYVEQQKEFTISASPMRIKADGVETTTFTVTYGEEDVTDEATIYCSNHENVTVEGNTFSTTVVGSYTFRAKYNGETTGVAVTVDAYDAALADKYEIGQIYEVNGVKGVIFAIKTDNHGDTYCYLFSLDEEDLQWSTKYEWCNCMSQVGLYNTTDPFKYWGQDVNDYPAFKWCMEHGEGWFLPSSTELNWMWDTITNGARNFDAPSVAEYNELIVENGGEPFCETYYWSSNETSEEYIEVIAFMDDSVVCLDPLKDSKFTARAAYRVLVE